MERYVDDDGTLQTQQSFELNPTQFHCFEKVAHGHPKHERHVGFFGGVGAGKTFFGALAAWQLCQDNEGCAGFIVAHDLKPLENEILPAFLRLVPEEWILNHSKKNRYFDFVGGRRVYYGTAKNWEALETYNVAWVWGDELRYWQRRAFDRLQSRVRDKNATNARCVWTSTPERNWMFREFGQGKAGRIFFSASTEENQHNLDEHYYDDLVGSMNQQNVEMYLGGQFHSSATGIFSFDMGTHVKPNLYDPLYQVNLVFDFGVRAPHCLIFHHYDYHYDFKVEDCICFVDEVIGEDGDHTDRFARKVKEYCHSKGYRIKNIYCDPAGRGRDQASGMTSVHALREIFHQPPKYTTDPNRTLVVNGIDTINRMLAPYRGDPSLFFDKSLTEDAGRGIINSLMYADHPRNRNDIATSDNYVKDGYYEHALDCCRYGVVNLITPPSTFYRVRS